MNTILNMPSAEELAASLEAGEAHDDKYLAGHGGRYSKLTHSSITV